MSDHTEVLEVDESPNLTALFARAAVGMVAPGGGGDQLPSRSAVRRDVAIDPAHLDAYREVCGFPTRDVVPPTYLHMLAFPLSMQLMTASDFPFALPGLVHVANQITQHRPVGTDEVVDVSVEIADLRPHPKGRQFDVVATVETDGEMAWSSTSTYLRRGSGASDDASSPAPATDAVDVQGLPLTSVWRVPSDIGRRYGAASGDRNPIHLSSLTAKAFGFPRAIAHGMWTKARAVAALEGRLPDAVTIEVAFKLPVMLPATVEYATAPDGDGWQLALRSRSGKPHLAGVVRPA